MKLEITMHEIFLMWNHYEVGGKNIKGDINSKNLTTEISLRALFAHFSIFQWERSLVNSGCQNFPLLDMLYQGYAYLLTFYNVYITIFMMDLGITTK